MSGNNPPYQLITELRRLRLAVPETDDQPQLPYSIAASNTEVLRELQAIREEVSDFKKTQWTLNRSMLDESKKVQKGLTDIDVKINGDLWSVKASMTNEGSSLDDFKIEIPFEKEIVGVWELIKSPERVEMAKYRKFSKNDQSFVEWYSSSQEFPDNGVSIKIAGSIVGNRLYTGNRRMLIKDSRLYINRSGVLEGVYRKVPNFLFSTEV